MALVYYAHPIDQAWESLGYVDTSISNAMKLHDGVTCFNPSNAWLVNKPFDARVQKHNEQVLRDSDSVLCYLPSKTWTRGVPAEIGIALEHRIPLVIVGDRDFGLNSLMETYWASLDHVQVFTVDQIDAAVNQAVVNARHSTQRVPAPLVARWTGDGAQLTQAHQGDAGFDLAYNGDEPFTIAPGQRAAVPTGVRVQLPEGFYSLIVGRSSSFSKRDLLIPLSVIDAGFRGELFAVCWNYGDKPQEIMPNERIAQLLPMSLVAPMIQWSNSDLTASSRGDLGFGSSGR
jgi:dUTP pyrophosphatase